MDRLRDRVQNPYAPATIVGYVEYRHAGGRHRAVARSDSDAVIPEGAIVQIKRVVGGEMLVAALDSQTGSASTAEPA